MQNFFTEGNYILEIGKISDYIVHTIFTSFF